MKNLSIYIPDSYGFYDDRKATNLVNKVARSAIQSLKAKPLAFVHLDTVKKGTILDVGCGTGQRFISAWILRFIDVPGNKGWRAHGCEISEDAAKVGVKAGLEIQTGRITEVTTRMATLTLSDQSCS